MVEPGSKALKPLTWPGGMMRISLWVSDRVCAFILRSVEGFSQLSISIQLMRKLPLVT